VKLIPYALPLTLKRREKRRYKFLDYCRIILLKVVQLQERKGERESHVIEVELTT